VNVMKHESIGRMATDHEGGTWYKRRLFSFIALMSHYFTADLRGHMVDDNGNRAEKEI
jgi:hypothetical protein